jgi:hypothetical protein
MKTWISFFLPLIFSTSVVLDYDIPKSVEQCRAKLREEFEKHRQITDIRVIDMLVIKVGVQDMFVCYIYSVCPFNALWGFRYYEL